MEGELVGQAASDPANEMIDVLDSEGRTIGIATRREVRVRRLPHRCVYILVFDSHGRLFIHLRTPTKDVYPSFWDVAIGGVLSAGESFLEGARREMLEEVGVAAELTELFPVRYGDPATVAFGMAYRAVHDGPFRFQPEEVVCGEFLTVNVVLERLTCDAFCPDGVMVLRQYLDKDYAPCAPPTPSNCPSSSSS